ncbi:MAG: hypothetical protein HY678_04535 [Chloroflexi bacterium]|nr:hypothetical protein [Chloroflexota bacterium]
MNVVTVPGFLLRRLYVKGSLHNRPDGWGFRLKNNLGSGYARGMLPLTIDGAEVPLENSFFTTDGAERPASFAEVDEKHTFGLQMGKAVLISVAGERLGAGAHTIGMGMVVPGLGKLRYDFSDMPADADDRK